MGLAMLAALDLLGGFGQWKTHWYTERGGEDDNLGVFLFPSTLVVVVVSG